MDQSATRSERASRKASLVEERGTLKKDRRIVFDASMARGGGGFTYAVNVIPVMARRMPTTEFLVVLRSQRIAEALPAVENLRIQLLPEAGILERFRFLTSTARSLARSFDADLYYSASELSPFSCPCPKVAAFRNPNLFTPLRLNWPFSDRVRLQVLKSMALYSARTCSRILFVSHDSAGWIGDLLGVPMQKRVVVPHGINPELWSRSIDPSPIGRRFILSVSSIYRYKNFVRLIEAWTTLAERWPEVPDLVIVGDDQDHAHSGEMRAARVRAGRLADRIHLVGEVPYARIAAYYRHADAFVFPSYLETFGHPLLEAMAAGIPVVAADIGVFREIGGDAAVYCDPHEPDSIANAIERVVRDQRTREELVAKGLLRVAEYSWDRTVDGMVAMFASALDSGRPRSRLTPRSQKPT